MSRVETIGDATLYLGDCREILPTLDRVETIVTDPPYLEGDFSTMLPALLPKARGGLVVTPGKLESFNWVARVKPDWEYIWRGAQTSLGGSACLHIGFEPILAYGLPKRPLGTDDLVFPICGTPNETGHPWPKPIGLIKKLVLHWSDAGETILDPFMGSGTTGVACAKLGRKFIGIEIEPKYYEIALKRIEAAYAQPDIFIPRPAPAKQEALL